MVMTKNRCRMCNKYSVIMFKCRCDFEYCNKHRLPEKHSCTNMSDFSSKEDLEKKLVKITGEKIEII